MGSGVIHGECSEGGSEGGSLDKGWLTTSPIVNVARDRRLFLDKKRVLTGGLRVLPRVKEPVFANPRFEKCVSVLH